MQFFNVRSVTQHFKDSIRSKKWIHTKLDFFERGGSVLVNYEHFSLVQVFWGNVGASKVFNVRAVTVWNRRYIYVIF